MKTKCECGKGIILVSEFKNFNLAPCICKKCWTKQTGISSPKYVMDEIGEIEIVKFKAVTQEKVLQLYCSDCKRYHTVGDVIIFLDCEVKRPSDGRIMKYKGGFFVIPPKKYWCLLQKG